MRHKLLFWLAYRVPYNRFTNWFAPRAIGWLMGARAKRVK